MIWTFLLGLFAALGFLCAVWSLLGWVFSRGQGGALVCLCRSDAREWELVHRYRWLKSFGLIRCPMLLVSTSLSHQEQQMLLRKYHDIEFCSLEELPARLELERNRLD